MDEIQHMLSEKGSDLIVVNGFKFGVAWKCSVKMCRARLYLNEIWASNSVTSERTTNACEAFHRALSLHFTSAHPNIFKFVEALKEIQTSTYIKLNDNENYNRVNPKYKKRKQYIEDLILKYTQRKTSKLHFLKSISYYYKHKN